MSSAFLVGRKRATIVPPHAGKDQLFAAERLDGTVIPRARYEHCTFANVSFKQAEIEDAEFRDCVFVDCYFRETRLLNSVMTSCRFIRCLFPKVEVRGCDFRSSTFEDCFIRFDEIQLNFPAEHNLRQRLSDSLERGALALLATKEASRFRQASIDARESHLREAVRASSSYYRAHFTGWGRLSALVELVASRLNGQLWGHGERWARLLRNFLLAALLVFPAIYLLLGNQLQDSSGNKPGLAEILLTSLDRMLLAGNVATVTAIAVFAQAIFILETAAGLIIVGLFVAMLLKSVTKR